MKYSPTHAVAGMAVAAVASVLLGAAHVEARECFTSDLMPHLHFTTTTTTATTTTATTTARWYVACAYLDDSVCHLSPEGCIWLDQVQACVKRVDGDSTATTSAATSVTTTNTSVVAIPDDCATLTVGVRKDICKWAATTHSSQNYYNSDEEHCHVCVQPVYQASTIERAHPCELVSIKYYGSVDGTMHVGMSSLLLLLCNNNRCMNCAFFFPQGSADYHEQCVDTILNVSAAFHRICILPCILTRTPIHSRLRCIIYNDNLKF